MTLLANLLIKLLPCMSEAEALKVATTKFVARQPLQQCD